jgi:hypothetical protein
VVTVVLLLVACVMKLDGPIIALLIIHTLR